jgi:ribosomal protein S18 acetylase RimI-like enzyme
LEISHTCLYASRRSKDTLKTNIFSEPHRLAVDPAFRGQGAATDSMLQAEVVAKQRNIRLLLVDTNTQNEATQRLFPNLGYVLAATQGSASARDCSSAVTKSD